MSSQNMFLDQRMKGKESFPDTVPWRDTLACWFSVMWLSICTACRFGMREGQAA